jgi:NADH-quinone oxidoreductase subunit F
MDIRLPDAVASAEERDAVDAVLGAPRHPWHGGERGSARHAHTVEGGRSVREQRPLLVPALQALQRRLGWISEGGLSYVCERLGVPPAEAWGVATFYALLATSPRPKRVVHLCDDIACRMRGAKAIESALAAAGYPACERAPHGERVVVNPEQAAWMHSPCLGLCEQAPAALLTTAGAAPHESLVGNLTTDRAIGLLREHAPAVDTSGEPATPQRDRSGLSLLKRVGIVDPTSLESYRGHGGFVAWEKARAIGAEAVIREVTAAKLVGRGGAAFPPGRQREAVRTQKSTPHYLVCNADESEPGTFKDRVLLTEDPFSIVEAMMIAAFATGGAKAYLYIRAEYPLAFARMTDAIAQCRDAGLFADGFDIEIRRGAGAYICGEETALFESIEGKRGEPRSKPPFPVDVGLFGKPTVVNNVETLANALPILLDGSEAFVRTGTADSTGTRLFCLSGAVARPGVYEVPFGYPLRSLLEDAGASPARAVLLGGAAGTFLRGDDLDLALSLEGARAAGTTLGSGVVMVFAEAADLHDAVRRIAGFFRDESCGQCVPCRVGTVRQEEALYRIAAGKTIGGVKAELALLEDVGVAMRDASICGLGQTAYAAVESAVKHLRLYEEMA